MASLESLNDDCLREILQYCDEDENIAFVIAFEQFKPIVQDIWKIFWKKLRLETTLRGIELFYPHDRVWRKINYESLKIVVDLIQPFVEEIYINGKNKEMLDIINKSQFTKASKLHLWNTSAAPIVKSCFPNLRSLVLVNCVVKYNPDWNGLEHLDVWCSDMRVSEIMEFISKLKLKKFTFDSFEQPIPEQYRNYEYFNELEEISGCIITMRKFANAFNVMPKLRKVSVIYEDFDMDADISMLSKMLGTRSVEFLYKCAYRTPTDFVKHLENQLQELPNLKRLTLEFTEIEGIQRFSRSCHLHLLKAIIFNGMRVDAAILTNILISVPQLELLEIFSYMKNCTIHLDVASITQNRSKPVIINVVPKYYNKVEILLSAATDLIKITKNPTAFPDCLVQYILEKQ